MIAIKGIKMPRNCVSCPFSGINCSVVPNFDNHSRPDDCPLREIVTLKDQKIVDEGDEKIFFGNDTKAVKQYIRGEIARDLLQKMRNSELIKISKSESEEPIHSCRWSKYTGEIYVVKD